MPQLSIYIDENTLQEIKKCAEIENLSISKYVVKTLNEKISNSWPENYHKLFGAITDESFMVEKPNDFSKDTNRETL